MSSRLSHYIQALCSKVIEMRMLKKFIYIVCFSYFIAIFLIHVDSTNSNKFIADYGIVYGNKVNEDGSLSKRLKARLDASIKLFENNRIKGLIVSGGVGKEGFSEADVMERYLLMKQVPKSAIIVDINGYTSSQTSKNAFSLIGGSNSVVAVSQHYHISRTKLSLRNAGFVNVYGYHPDYYEIRDIYSIVREVPAWLKYWFNGL